MIDAYVSREELRRLLAGLVAVVGAILLWAIFAMLIVPGGRNANRPPTDTSLAPPAGESGWLDVTEYPPARGYEVPPLDPNAVMTATPEMLARGRALFVRNCTACHGDAGRGDGPASRTLNPRPRDLTSAAGWKNGPGMSAMFHTLGSGIAGSAMVAYDFLGKSDRMALVHFAQSLGRFPRPPEAAGVVADLAKELGAPGERVPNRIPVTEARARLATEYTPARPLAAVGPVSQRAIADGARAAAVLAGAAGWRAGPVPLAMMVTAGIPGNGFRPEAALLTADEWQALWADLVREGETGR